MYKPRKIECEAHWLDEDGIKLYTVSFTGRTVNQLPYRERLRQVKLERDIDWATTAAFAILHDGADRRYLVLAWWGNDNELFTSVSAQTELGWVEDPSRYSFCLYDMEIMWGERNIYIATLDCAQPSLQAYRARRALPDYQEC